MTKFDINTMVTDRIITQLENGVIPWHKPWISAIGNRCGAYSGATGKPYSLLNQMLMEPGEYWTFKQVQERGGKVKKGAKSSVVVFWKWLDVEVETDGEKELKKIPFLKYYNVFNVNDCEGIERKYPEAQLPEAVNTDEKAEAIVNAYISGSGVKLEHHNQNRAFYRPATDSITLPTLEQFSNTSEYYSTAFHEMTHSTGHTSRLNRLVNTAHFGNEEYSKEELVAEIGAAALVNIAGLETESSFKNNAAYIQSWLKALKNDSKMIVSAASRAQKAVDLIMSYGA